MVLLDGGIWNYLVVGLQALAILVAVPITLLVVVTFLLAFVTWLRTRKLQDNDKCKSSLCVGRVIHTRFSPVVHSFSYPIFFAAVDLEEAQDLFFGQKQLLWPLHYVMSFRTCDHLKNGEGMSSGEKGEIKVLDRIFCLIAQCTSREFQPTSTTHSVILLTNLRYFGYCFNPISLYFCVDKKTDKLDCIVAEVSNTPWNEMRCYVLHPKSIHTTSYKSNDKNLRVVNPKTFHVSPFMEMDHIYDWTFDNSLSLADKESNINVNITSKKQEETFFAAFFSVQPRSLLTSPWSCAWTLLTFPLYCVVVQLWIHYEAILLFAKGVSFVPHPHGSETTASRMIGAAMKPIFAIKAWIQQNLGNNSESNVKDKVS